MQVDNLSKSLHYWGDMKTVLDCETIASCEDTVCAAKASDRRWSTFQQVNQDRRAVRDFDGSPIPDPDVEAVLNEALLAPSSGNSQPYVIHWLRNPAIKAAAASACRDQRAARSASVLLVFVSANRFAHKTMSMFRDYVESTPELSEKSRNYYLRQLKTNRWFLRIAPSVLWSPLRALLTTVFPSLALLPLGPGGIRNWVVRSTLFAAQTALLAASARGLDTCPMEGFDPRRLARILGLKRGDVIAIVVALGRRRPDALIEPRWRRPFEAALHIHV
jgi:nitroreductase